MKFPFEVPPQRSGAILNPTSMPCFPAWNLNSWSCPRAPVSSITQFSKWATRRSRLPPLILPICAPDKVSAAILANPIVMVIIRTMLGFTPSEWGYVTSQRTGIQVPQGCIRSLDRRVRVKPTTRLTLDGVTGARLRALVETACALLVEGAPSVSADQLHRLDKADTRHGVESIRNLADLGVPYAMLLYERFLGRPFAGHRDSVSELVGDVLESAVENVLSKAGISYRKTRRAERLDDFDQAPDFIVPSEFNPQIIIEVKITEDDGTARDKVTRIQHLGEAQPGGTSKR